MTVDLCVPRDLCACIFFTSILALFTWLFFFVIERRVVVFCHRCEWYFDMHLFRFASLITSSVGATSRQRATKKKRTEWSEKPIAHDVIGWQDDDRFVDCRYLSIANADKRDSHSHSPITVAAVVVDNKTVQSDDDEQNEDKNSNIDICKCINSWTKRNDDRSIESVGQSHTRTQAAHFKICPWPWMPLYHFIF